MAETMHDPKSRFQRQSRQTTPTWCHFEPTLTKNLRVLRSPPCDSSSLSKLCGLSKPKRVRRDALLTLSERFFEGFQIFAQRAKFGFKGRQFGFESIEATFAGRGDSRR
jgi:hypothetical protein